MRPIDADALKDSFCEACSTKKRYKRTDAECRTHSNALYGYSCFKMRLINTAPTIDAEPVRRGRWEGKKWSYLCSICGGLSPEDGGCKTNYCPDCGAKMDLEAQHAETD